MGFRPEEHDACFIWVLGCMYDMVSGYVHLFLTEAVLCLADVHPRAGREKFVDEVHKWVEDKGGKILQQLRRLGASPDWSRQAYTMTPQLSRAVLESFLRMHAGGLIYRDNRLVNWDTRLQSAVSDIEVPPPGLLSLAMYSWELCV